MSMEQMKFAPKTPEERQRNKAEREKLKEKTGLEDVFPTKGYFYVKHPSFEKSNASQKYKMPVEGYEDYMPDELTQAWAKTMHFAGFKAATSVTENARGKWRAQQLLARDAIFLGNQKLVFTASNYMRNKTPVTKDDLDGDGNLIFLDIILRYNPWLQVRFCTYAYTCLTRWHIRRGKMETRNKLRQQELIADPAGRPEAEEESVAFFNPKHFLDKEHPLLTDREKLVIGAHFGFQEQKVQSLKGIGDILGLSRERIRQVKESALRKLRLAMESQL